MRRAIIRPASVSTVVIQNPNIQRISSTRIAGELVEFAEIRQRGPQGSLGARLEATRRFPGRLVTDFIAAESPPNAR